MTDAPMLSASTRELLTKVRQMVPPMLEKFHKGQLGRIAVIGGSKDYTGAPYFSAMASARLGADMSHVICTPGAAAVIKTYSPNLMVHPLMCETPSSSSSAEDRPSPNSSNGADDNTSSSRTAESVAEAVGAMLSRLHALVIGPGLGRDSLMQASCAAIIRRAREARVPVVLDADALLVVNSQPDLVRGWKEVVLTPNVVEFGRLAKALGIDDAEHQNTDRPAEACQAVSRALGGVLVLQKGSVDYLSNGDKTWVCDVQGGKKRSGGQGDTLTGAIGTLLCWRRAYLDDIWEREGGKKLDEEELIMLAAFGGACITRECSRLAFAKHGRALMASDVGEQVPLAFRNIIGEREGSKL